jgi:hypothetical protein
MIALDWHDIIPVRYIYPTFGLVAAAVIIVVRATAKSMFGTIKEEWRLVTARLERMEGVQGVEASNHLTHIQESCNKSVEILQAICVEQAESNGYLRAITNEYLKDIRSKQS